MCPEGTASIATARASRDTGGIGYLEDCPGKAGNDCDFADGGHGQVRAAGGEACNAGNREACNTGNGVDQAGGVCTASEACRVGAGRKAPCVLDDCEAGTSAREASVVNNDREARTTRCDQTCGDGDGQTTGGD